jgi:glutathione synthase/RimK-type ligase-like ATP-grasp enzyme
MRKRVVVIEVPFGDKKLRDDLGFRKDSMPIVEALEKCGVHSEIEFYTDDKDIELAIALSRADAVISRVNPGNLPHGEMQYFKFLNGLSKAGVEVMSDPDTMTDYGAKDALAKLAKTDLVPDDTYAYYSLRELREEFPKTLAIGKRVLKQNRGSQGEGIWLVEVDPNWQGEIADETPIKATEMKDNHTEEKLLGDFMDLCGQYFVGENAMMVDMQFLPRITEGEIRVLMVGRTPVFVIHKVPEKGEFSATLGSGAEYTYQKPEDWPDLIEKFLGSIDTIENSLGGHPTPLIWTADFILGPKKEDKDTYILGEINCSCVGFTSELDAGIQELIADEVMRKVGEPVEA